MPNPADIVLDDLPEGFRRVAEIVGMEAALTLAEELGGEAVYFPKADKIRRHARNRAIRREFDGRNYRHLARKHNLTVVMIRQILGEKNDGKTGVDVYDRQRPLFDF